MRQIPGPLGDVGVRPRRRGGHGEALDGPGRGRRRPLVPECLTPADLAQQLHDAPVDGGPRPEELVELSEELLVGEPSHAGGAER